MEQGTEAGVTLVTMLVGVCIGAVMWAIIGAALAFFFKSCLDVLAPHHQKQVPDKVWYIAIPYFGAYWNFNVIPKVAESFQSHFAEQGDTSEGDCGQQFATILCALVAFNVVMGIVGNIPLVGLISALSCLTGPASLILLIVVIVKFVGLKSKVTTGA